MIEMISIYDILQIPLIVLIAVIGIFLGLLYKGIERRLGARMQARIGPPITQPFRDVKKLMMKENIVPKDAVKWLFNLMPVMALATSIAILLYLPLFGLTPVLEGHGDMILVLYLLIFPSLALALGGFTSGSPYATVGAQREIVTMLSYEVPFAIVVISITWLISTVNFAAPAFSLLIISNNPVWAVVGQVGSLGVAFLFLSLLLVMPGKLGSLPFDAPEAETEIAGGVLVEYSGRNLALFYLADAVKIVAFASIIIALFFPFGIAGILGVGGLLAIAADALFFLIKLFIIIFLGSTFVRFAIARLRITQVVNAYLINGTLIALLGLVLIWLDVLLKVI